LNQKSKTWKSNIKLFANVIESNFDKLFWKLVMVFIQMVWYLDQKLWSLCIWILILTWTFIYYTLHFNVLPFSLGSNFSGPIFNYVVR